ncbi:MAG TPA: secretin N-terminal domain-containing protein [Longimicrobiales bacterium]
MKWLVLTFACMALVACNKTRGMEVRTYELSRLDADQVQTLLTPYIGDGGTIVMKKGSRLITVRDRPERLKLIEAVLKKYDGSGEAADVMLDLQVVQADGFSQRDSALADIEPTLRQTFRYRGYRLLGETHVRVREDNGFEQNVGDFAISGRVHRIQPGASEKRLPIDIQLQTPMQVAPNGLPRQDQMGTTVTATLGKPMVLGQSTRSGAIILVIRPSLAPM